ncbi:hypothetical protein PoB_003221400 [Plakobranchus ocellatus]|uniref:Uncharacterized protein n=1 Tax=Plakobranchus ocellatus TaxID=259542 RepID=A0AAV4AH03_9GAST|nr:hypothetical protein PoB_003221400 [Plakobranchus ocellatus]
METAGFLSYSSIIGLLEYARPVGEKICTFDCKLKAVTVCLKVVKRRGWWKGQKYPEYGSKRIADLPPMSHAARRRWTSFQHLRSNDKRCGFTRIRNDIARMLQIKGNSMEYK